MDASALRGSDFFAGEVVLGVLGKGLLRRGCRGRKVRAFVVDWVLRSAGGFRSFRDP